MKWLTNKKILNKSSGESLVESVVSICVLAILLVCVSTILIRSLDITRATNKNLSAMQDIANNLVLEKYTMANPSSLKITSDSSLIDVTVNVNVAKEGGLVSFSPEVTP